MVCDRFTKLRDPSAGHKVEKLSVTRATSDKLKTASTMDLTNLTDERLKEFRRGPDIDLRLKAKDELDRRKREKRQLKNSGEWWTRTGVLVAASAFLVSVYLPEIRTRLGLDQPTAPQKKPTQESVQIQPATPPPEDSGQNSPEAKQPEGAPGRPDARGAPTGQADPASDQTETSPVEDQHDANRKPIDVSPIITGSNKLTPFSAGIIAAQAQQTAA